jgi:UDP-2,4-diacetamido-2,4,6-trideoxy-beta-L-altropyranose hydrolase
MNILFRVEASLRIGTGHLVRCLTLAEMLRERGCAIFFVCRELPEHQKNQIDNKGYKLHRLSSSVETNTSQNYDSVSADSTDVDWERDAQETLAMLSQQPRMDWLIVDHYGLDISWETSLRSVVNNVMVIDDLADRPHDCDVLLDQNLCDDFETRYNNLVPKSCCKLLGPKYVLLRTEFIQTRTPLQSRSGEVKCILVFFGGSDRTNETKKTLEALQLINRPDIAVDVVVGGANPHKGEIQRLCSGMTNVRFHCQVNNMAELMLRADFAIGAGGTTTWERCFLALPTIVLITAPNQFEGTTAVAKRGAVCNLGYSHDINAETLATTIQRYLKNPAALNRMGQKAKELMGDGVIDGRAKIIETILGE